MNHVEEMKKVQEEKEELQTKLEDMMEQESVLTAKVESLQADNDFTKEQLTNTKGMLKGMLYIAR